VVVSTGENVHLHPSSILNNIHPPWVVFEEITSLGNKNGKTYIKNISEVELEWLIELAP
jgi:Oligonucleotide/oligosaccharide-binding (OB)-fold